MHAIRASARYSRAIHAVAELLEKLKVDAMFVGGVARAAWLDTEVGTGAIDVIAVLGAQQMNHLAMMASNRGFRVDRDEVEQAVELDLVPLNFLDDDDGEVRVHVLLASNALYGRMVAAAVTTTIDERTVKIPRAEDLALMLLMAEDQEAMAYLTALPEFDIVAFRARLASIGLGAQVSE